MAHFTWRSFDAGQTSISSGDAALDPAGVVDLRHRACSSLQFLARFFQALLGLPLEDLSMHGGAGRRMILVRRSRMLDIVVTMFAMLFAFLAGGLWIGWTLARHRHRAARDLPRHPARQAAGAVRLEHPDHAGAAGAADVHPDGRDPVPHAPVAVAVPRARAVGRRCCRAACCTSTSSAARSSRRSPARRPRPRRWSAASRSPSC